MPTIWCSSSPEKMKNKFTKGLLAFLIALPAAHAVTVSPVVISASSTVDGVTNSTTPRTFANGSGGIVTATTSSLVLTNPGGAANFELTDPTTPSVFASTSVSRNNTGNGTNNVSSQIVYQIAFTLGISETADVSFDFNYDLTDLANVNGLITWSLVGPGATNVFTPGSVGTTGTAQNLVGVSIAQQTATISTAGTYTLTLSGALTATNFAKNTAASTVNFNTIDFKVTSLTPVPEPSGALLGLLGAGLLIGRRRRI